MRTRSKKARENTCGHVAIDFSFESDWLRKWREFSEPIPKRIKAKLTQLRIMLTLD